jgi:hypothetical protein
MKVLFVNLGVHHKILHAIKNYKNITFTEVKDINQIPEEQLRTYDAIYAPSRSIDVKKYNYCKFIFGPQFSVFPDNPGAIEMIKGMNSMYIQPSKWALDVWKNYKFNNTILCKDLNMGVLPFGVDTERFKPLNNIPRDDKNRVFLYKKSRSHYDYSVIVNFLQKRNIDFKIFSYNQRYSEDEYFEYLQHAKYGIWVGIHESQGFALEEALSCNVPLFVWSVTSMNQEIGPNYDNIPATTIPYWDERCGEYFHRQDEIDRTFDLFLSKLDTYKPREYVVENLSFDACENIFKNCIKQLDTN